MIRRETRNRHERADTVLVVPLTTSIHKDAPTHVFLMPRARSPPIRVSRQPRCFLWHSASASLGLAAPLAAGRLVTSLLYGVRSNDPIQLAGAVLILAAATAIAAYVPARRAARLDPMSALREE